jgi:hypothetical protein
MAYFENLPILDYEGNKIRDIFKNVVITNTPSDDWYNVYQLNDNETLYDVSLKLYGTVDYWWLLAIINGVNDLHYDIYMNDNMIQKLAKDTQILSFSNTISDYLIFPQETLIYCSTSTGTISGEVTKKYIENGKYLLEVRLSDVEKPFPSSFTGILSSERVQDIAITNEDAFSLGEWVYRQDFLDEDGYVRLFARGYCVNKRPDSGTMYRISDVKFELTGATILVNNLELTASPLYQMDYLAEVVSFTISSANVINEFQLEIPEEYVNSYLDRYDELEEINNRRRVIRVFKPEHRDTIITQFTNKLK